MRTMSRVLLGLLLVALMGAVSVPALAGPNGTTSGETTANALPTGDTLPQAAGEMSVRWTNTTGGDTQYDDTSTNIVTTVDTGFDMSRIDSDPAVPANLSAGDSVVYEMPVRNLGNNATDVPFNFNQIATSGTTGSFTWELFAENDDAGGGDSLNSFDTGSETRITDTSPSIPMAENELDTLYAVITAKSSAGNGDTIENRLFATDNAPIDGPGSNDGALLGDQWEDSGVIATEDARDTQYVFYTTTVSGPVLDITKNIDGGLSSGSYRPGDTVGYRITVTNSGSDTADNVEVVDAMPDSTTYVVGSAGVSNVDNGNAISTEFDDGFAGFGDGESESSERVKWDVDAIGPSSQSNSSVEVTFQVTID